MLQKNGKKRVKNPGRALYFTANFACAVASRDPEAALSTLSKVIKFHHTGKRINLKDFV